jgi:hypothetical protein
MRTKMWILMKNHNSEFRAVKEKAFVEGKNPKEFQDWPFREEFKRGFCYLFIFRILWVDEVVWPFVFNAFKEFLMKAFKLSLGRKRMATKNLSNFKYFRA